MKRIIFIVVAWLGTSPVSAQSWSPEQQAVIDQITRCNDGWVESIARKTFELYAMACPETREARFWYPNGAAPLPYGGPDGVWSRSAAANRAVSWQDLKPVTVQVDGDVAFIYYTVTWTTVPVSGDGRPAPSRRLTVFRRVNGRWHMAGGTITAAQ